MSCGCFSRRRWRVTRCSSRASRSARSSYRHSSVTSSRSCSASRWSDSASTRRSRYGYSLPGTSDATKAFSHRTFNSLTSCVFACARTPYEKANPVQIIGQILLAASARIKTNDWFCTRKFGVRKHFPCLFLTLQVPRCSYCVTLPLPSTECTSMIRLCHHVGSHKNNG